MTRRILKDLQPDVLHAHRVTGAGWIGAFSGFHPLVVTPWGSDINTYPYRSFWAYWLTKKVMHQADLVAASTNDLLNKAVFFGARIESTRQVSWGVDLQVFHPADDIAPLREKLGLGGTQVVFSPRAVSSLYHQDTIVAAFAEVCTQVPGARLLLLDFNSDPVYKQRLQEQIAELGLSKSIYWLEPVPYGSQMADLYRLADVMVSIPENDGAPVSVLEAMACGTPVVASELASLREWITPGENGELVPVGDAHATAQAIHDLLVDPDKRERYRLKSLDMIQHHNHEAEMGKMEKLYEALAMRKAGIQP